VNPRTCLDAAEKRKISFSCRGSNLGRPAHSLSLDPLRDEREKSCIRRFRSVIASRRQIVNAAVYSLIRSSPSIGPEAMRSHSVKVPSLPFYTFFTHIFQ
jgi:hypothetical protein